MADQKKNEFMIPTTRTVTKDGTVVHKCTKADVNTWLQEQGLTPEVRALQEKAFRELQAQGEQFLATEGLANKLTDQELQLPIDGGRILLRAEGPREVRAGVPAKGETGAEVEKRVRHYNFVTRVTLRDNSELLKDGGQIQQHEEAYRKVYESAKK